MQLSRSIPNVRRIARHTVVGLLVAGVASAALWADNDPISVAAGGDFDRSAVSLRLPGVERFPLVAGGWGARADDARAIRSTRDAFEGDRAVEIEASAQLPAHIVQDVPLGTHSFRLELAVQRVRGRQALMLFDDWDRTEPGTARATLRLELMAGGIALSTPRGSWQIDSRLQPDRWLRLAIETDARDDQTRVFIDDALVGILPGIPARAPRTLLIGGDRGREASLFRYDSVALLRLAEIELAELRDLVVRDAPAELPATMARLTTAAQVIEMGVPYLAAPELRAAARALDGAEIEAATREALAALLALLEAS